LIKGAPPRSASSSAARDKALVLRADRSTSILGKSVSAEGQVELRYGDILLRTESLRLAEAQNEVVAPGAVEVQHLGSQVKGRALRLELDAFLGELLEPTYRIAQTGGSGQAQRLDFLGQQRLRADAASYSSCPRVDEQGQPVAPDWELRTDRLQLDLASNVGVAEGAVLRFMGVPLLAAPAFSFPLGDQRRSGWLPPHLGADNRSGFEVAVPYYFNIADNADATLTPFVMTRRGFGGDGELRGLLPWGATEVQASWLPNDRVLGEQRWGLRWNGRAEADQGLRVLWETERVSDDDYWKDLRRRIDSPTPRLLPSDLQVQQAGAWGDALNWQGYARLQRWQVLQTTESSTQIVAPFQREPQLGLRLSSRSELAVLAGFMPPQHRPGLEGGLELEYNRFTLPSAALPGQSPGGERLHALAHWALPVVDPAWWLIPRLDINAAAYRVKTPMADGRLRAQRVVPTVSLDLGMAFERTTTLLGRELLQSLEPRLLFVNTPYRSQESLPNFDSAVRDFNVESLYAINPFTGVDRVADARQLSFGAVSRWLNPQDGEEQLRLGLVQRYQFRPQRLSPDPDSRRFSDLLLTVASHLRDPWYLDGAVQFNPDNQRSVRSVLRARFNPGPYRTISLAYRFQRDRSEQLDLAWQWPLAGRQGVSASGQSCQGRWYSAGRVQYSLRESRVTDSLLGLEYNSGCWVLRMGVERLSTGLSQANTRFLIQLELVGLSRLGANALKVLRDNVPGYRPLASDDGLPATP
jgi:LPS-assembly protein